MVTHLGLRTESMGFSLFRDFIQELLNSTWFKRENWVRSSSDLTNSFEEVKSAIKQEHMQSLRNPEWEPSR